MLELFNYTEAVANCEAAREELVEVGDLEEAAEMFHDTKLGEARSDKLICAI